MIGVEICLAIVGCQALYFAVHVGQNLSYADLKRVIPMSSQLLTIEGVYDGKTIQAAKNKAFVYKVIGEIREGMLHAGLSEEDILTDFERFRRTLPRE